MKIVIDNVLRFFFIFLIVILLAEFVTPTSPRTIFADNFDEGNYNFANVWQVINNPQQLPNPQGAWNRTNITPLTSPYHLQANPGYNRNSGNTSLQKTISTVGFININLSYARRIKGAFKPGEDKFVVYWSADGNTFSQLEEVNISHNIIYVNVSFSLPATASNNANFKIRFDCVTSAISEFCLIDNINITGIPIQSLSINPTTQNALVGRNATVTVKNTGASLLSNILMTEMSSFGATFSPQSFSLTPGAEQPVTISLRNLQNLVFGNNLMSVKARDNIANAESTATINVQKSFCNTGPIGGNLSIDRVRIKNLDGDDDEWTPLDNIELSVRVRNDGQDRIRSVRVELGLFDSQGRNRIGFLDFTGDNKEFADLGTISDGRTSEAKFKIKVPADISVGNYKLAVKAYSRDIGESRECTDSSDDLNNRIFQTIEIDRESDEGRMVVIDDIEIQSEALCGETINGKFTVFNIGDMDQERVKITLINRELGLNNVFEISQDLDEGDSRSLDFSLTLPKNVRDGNYVLQFRTFYDYRNGVYRKESKDSFPAFIKLIGCSLQDKRNIMITASLDSEARAGQKMTVTSNIRNMASETITLSIDVNGYQSWASLDSISKRTLTLNPGESQTVVFVFTLNDNASGKESFIIQTSSNGKIENQEIEVNIAEKEKRNKFFSFEENSMLIWIIGAINLILIILIIVVAIKMSRR